MTKEKKEKTYQVRLNLSESAMNELKGITYMANAKSTADVIRDALSLFAWIYKERLKGAKIVLQYPGKKRDRLILWKDEK